MLKTIRDGADGWLVRGLLLLIIAGFAFWGVQGVGSSTPQPVARVGGTPVSQIDFQLLLRREVNRLRAEGEEDYTMEQALDDKVDVAVLNRMMVAATFDRAAEGIGLRASDALVYDLIRSVPQFNDGAGNFDAVSYQQELERLNKPKRTFEEDRRTELERSHLIDTIMSGVKSPSVFVNKLFEYSFEERAIDYFVLSDATMDVSAPEEVEIRAYFDAHPEQFSLSEFRGASFISIRISDVINFVEIDEERIEEAYEDRRDDFVVMEKRQLLHVVVDDETAADDFMAKVNGGTTFVAAAVETGALDSEVDLGDVTEEDIAYFGDDATLAAFAATSGTVTDPIANDLGGLVIFKVGEITPGTTRTLDDAHEGLRTDLAIQEAQLKIEDHRITALEELAADETLESVAKTLGLRVGRFNSMDQTGLDQNGNVVPNIPLTRAFIASIFSRKLDDLLDVEETGGGGYFIVRVDSITPSTLKPYESVRNDVIKAVNADNRHEVALGRAEELRAAANAASSLEAAAKEAGAKVTAVDVIRRDGAGVPASFSLAALEALYNVESGSVIAATNRAGDGVIVARLRSISRADRNANGGTYKRLSSNIQRLYANDILSQYHTYLSDQYPSITNETTMNLIRESLVDQ